MLKIVHNDCFATSFLLFQQHNENKSAPSTHDIAMMGNPAYEISNGHPLVMVSGTECLCCNQLMNYCNIKFVISIPAHHSLETITSHYHESSMQCVYM